MTAQDLKNAILQLAVQGKLVPQDPNDEPASELLKRIKAEKERLIKEGKIKKEKPLSPISEDEIPFDIPESWEWIRFGECGVLKSGFPFKSTEYTVSGIQVVRISDLAENNISCKNAVFYPQSDSLTPYYISNNSFLICMTGSIGKMAWVKDALPRYLNQRVGMFEPLDNCDTSYLWWFLHTNFVLFKWIDAKTSTNGNIKNSDITDLLFPLPPLAEQERIVAKIEELMPLVEEYGKVEERLTALNAEFPDKLRKSILQQAIQGKLTERDPADEPASELLKRIRAEKERLVKEGKIKKEKPLPSITEEEMPFEIPENWEWVRLGDLGETQTGTTPSTKDSRFFGKDIPFIKPADIFCDHINYDNEGLSYLGSEQSRIIQANSVMMVCIGGSIGKTYHNDRDVCCNQQINTITPIQCNTMFIWLVLSSNYFFEALQFRATGTATPIVNKNLWCNIPVPLPPLAEQQRIVDRVNELLAVCDELE